MKYMYIKFVLYGKNIFYGLAGENVMKVGMRQLPCTNSASFGNHHVRTCIHTRTTSKLWMYWTIMKVYVDNLEIYLCAKERYNV